MTSPFAPVRLGHLVPERRPVVVSRTNPLWLALSDDDPRRAETPELVDMVLHAYVFGPRCPGIVKAELASIHETYLQATAKFRAEADRAEDDDAPLQMAAFTAAWHTFLRETICTLVPGLTSGEADVLAAVPLGEDGPGTALLRDLALWTPESPDAPDPEVAGEASQPTMALSSPSSPVSTDSAPPSS